MEITPNHRLSGPAEDTWRPLLVTMDSVVVHSTQVMHQQVGNEVVLLDLSGETYFGLNPLGSRIWNLINGSSTLQDVHRVLCSEYAADESVVGQDLLDLTKQLLAAGLVEAK